MINPDPWSEWKAGKTDGESNEWTDYQQENPVKVADLSESAVDPLEAIAGGALATLIGKGLGTAISAMFADGGMVRKPKTEQEARTNRQRRNRLAQARGDLRLATGGAADSGSNQRNRARPKRAGHEPPHSASAAYRTMGKSGKQGVQQPRIRHFSSLCPRVCAKRQDLQRARRTNDASSNLGRAGLGRTGRC